jgi:hypothetical protein
MPSDPLRDAQGKIIPHDHPDIGDDCYVIRHISPPYDLHPEEQTGIVRVASGAYSESKEGGMSVDIEAWMIADGLDPCHYLSDPAEGATRILVGELRKLGMKVGWDPDSGHIHHGAVWGVGSSKRRKIARLAITVRKAEGET